MKDAPRTPQAFVLESGDAGETSQPKPVKQSAARRHSPPVIELVEEPADLPAVQVPHTVALQGRRRYRWLSLLLATLTALISMWAGLAITQLVEDFFARSAVLGWVALALAGIAAVAAIAIVFREIVGLLRLNSMEDLQDRAARAINLNDRQVETSALKDLRALYEARPEMRAALATFTGHDRDIMDPRDRMRLAERVLLEPLDDQARKLIAARARRVTLLTTVTPAAALDILFVAAQNFAMLRDIAALYGGKPSTLATLRLGRMVVAHLAVAGGLALSDNLLQHVLGRGLLGRISARLGEGAVNGILTSRIGLAAIAVCRPIPGQASGSETLASLLKEVLSFPAKNDRNADQKPQS